MKTNNVVAIIESHGDPLFVPIKLTIPECDCHGTTQALIRELNGGLVNWRKEFPVIFNFNDPISKKIYDLIDWDSATELAFDVSKYTTISQAYRHWKYTFKFHRVRELEPFFAQDEDYAERYVKNCIKIEWAKWTDDELLVSPVYMFYYAMKVCKGKLPEHLDNAMNMISFHNPDSSYVKRYFGTKRYRIRSGKSILPKDMTPTEYSEIVKKELP